MNAFYKGKKRAQNPTGEEDFRYNALGAITIAFFAWRDGHSSRAHEVLKRYCKYLDLHGYGRGAGSIVEKLDAMNNDAGKDWIAETYNKYVQDETAFLQYVFGGM